MTKNPTYETLVSKINVGKKVKFQRERPQRRIQEAGTLIITISFIIYPFYSAHNECIGVTNFLIH